MAQGQLFAIIKNLIHSPTVRFSHKHSRVEKKLSFDSMCGDVGVSSASGESPHQINPVEKSFWVTETEISAGPTHLLK